MRADRPAGLKKRFVFVQRLTGEPAERTKIISGPLALLRPVSIVELLLLSVKGSDPSNVVVWIGVCDYRQEKKERPQLGSLSFFLLTLSVGR